MVMHARKPQRISDGYFEKHQAHPYQKYNSKRAGNDYNTPDNRYTPLRSPNGNIPTHSHGGHMGHTGHSAHGHHHYSHMPEDRGYVTSRNSYMQKGSEKERDRDYKSSRNKYTDVRSPKEKRIKDCEREKNNHERCEPEKKSRNSGMNSSVNRSSKYDKRSAPSTSVHTANEWTEHISSSGKRYYYNSVSEISQWEKPREWDSRRTTSKDSTYSTRNMSTNNIHQFHHEPPPRKNSKWRRGGVRQPPYKKVETPFAADNCRDKRSSSRTGRREAEKTNKRSNNTSDRYWGGNREDDGHDRPRPKRTNSQHEGKDGQTLQDMDISPDRSTPLSENSYVARENASARADGAAVPPVVVLDNSNQTSGSLLAAALPRIVAMPQVTCPNAGGNVGIGMANNGGSPTPGGADTPHRDAGPPTPTHSENIDPHAPPLHLETALPRKMECLGSYSSVVGGSLQAAPMLTPSLMNYVRTDLMAHVQGWPADILEKQANKFTEEAYQLSSLQCTRVSAELKCSRSVVRHTEIQATLQEQKIMYMRQQISRLEELKSQNSFMSED